MILTQGVGMNIDKIHAVDHGIPEVFQHVAG
jgi:hypothetical protein